MSEFQKDPDNIHENFRNFIALLLDGASGKGRIMKLDEFEARVAELEAQAEASIKLAMTIPFTGFPSEDERLVMGYIRNHPFDRIESSLAAISKTLKSYGVDIDADQPTQPTDRAGNIIHFRPTASARKDVRND